MNHSELLLAAAVLDLAIRIRNASIPDEVATEDFPKWKAEHPASDFVPEALKRIQATADQIKALQS